jgi:hypothetical protein
MMLTRLRPTTLVLLHYKKYRAMVFINSDAAYEDIAPSTHLHRTSKVLIW